MVSHTRMGLGVTDEVRERNREWEQRREKGIEGVRELGMKDRESVREKLGGYKGERERNQFGAKFCPWVIAFLKK